MLCCVLQCMLLARHALSRGRDEQLGAEADCAGFELRSVLDMCCGYDEKCGGILC